MIPTGAKVTIRESRTLASAVQLQSASNPGRNNIELTKVSMDKVERWLLDIDDNVSEAWRFTSKVIDRVLDEYARQVAWGFSRSFEAGSGDIQRRDRQDVRVVDVRGVGGQAEASPAPEWTWCTSQDQKLTGRGEGEALPHGANPQRGKDQ